MKSYIALITAVVALSLAACSSPADKKDNAQAEYTEEKTKTLQEYKQCISASDGNQEKLVLCEALLKAVGAVEGATLESSASTYAE